ncbi:hypothetical protein JY651_12335 [Pyxidicoccus parkwayensis]|jgi:hypothetical protein|uniref:Lipoprotein n=1 Tax=Pyxidicoccus parkwayensis TaxID=2813578 RepID=A0ABX7P5B5_9BACT|nr:hypothetical protein [Pyxidicoccus parkwaysis]QSQ25663.1 hypothetical protein JY651_12335 [Pyxidicoccus parkwaysis]
MIRTISHTVLVLTLLMTGCHRADTRTASPHANAEQGSPPTEATDEQAPTIQDGPRAPAVVRWVRLEQRGSRLELRAEVVKQSPFTAPLAVQVQVPAGVRLVEGSEAWEVPADAPQGIHARELAFTIDAASSEPIQLTADAQGAGFGVHAVDAFRVNGSDKSLTREGERQGPMPQPVGPAVKVGNTDFGNTIPSP